MLTAIAGAAVVYLFLLATLYLAQRKLLYFPNAVEIPPVSLGLDAQILRLRTEDGETLLAWYFAPAPGKPLIIYFHGNGGGIDLRADRFRRIAASGDGVLAVEYRGYAGSTGSPSEAGLIGDGEAAYRQALAFGIPPERIVLMGESLGSGVAVAIATRRKVGAIVLDSPYSSNADVASAFYWMFPVRALIRDAFQSDQRIGRVVAPVLMVCGTEDKIIPIRFSEKLFALANAPKDFWPVEGAGHLAMGERMPEALEWIARNLR
ncbi:MAG: alpha/beta hydrolase [Roseiarcus sp.]